MMTNTHLTIFSSHHIIRVILDQNRSIPREQTDSKYARYTYICTYLTLLKKYIWQWNPCSQTLKLQHQSAFCALELLLRQKSRGRSINEALWMSSTFLAALWPAPVQFHQSSAEGALRVLESIPFNSKQEFLPDTNIHILLRYNTVTVNALYLSYTQTAVIEPSTSRLRKITCNNQSVYTSLFYEHMWG